jgi:hypothetical protein
MVEVKGKGKSIDRQINKKERVKEDKKLFIFRQPRLIFQTPLGRQGKRQEMDYHTSYY